MTQKTLLSRKLAHQVSMPPTAMRSADGEVSTEKKTRTFLQSRSQSFGLFSTRHGNFKIVIALTTYCILLRSEEQFQRTILLLDRICSLFGIPKNPTTHLPSNHVDVSTSSLVAPSLVLSAIGVPVFFRGDSGYTLSYKDAIPT